MYESCSVNALNVWNNWFFFLKLPKTAFPQNLKPLVSALVVTLPASKVERAIRRTSRSLASPKYTHTWLACW